MNAPWMNTTGSPLPETSYSSSDLSVLALSNRCLPLGTPAASGECCRSLLSSVPFYSRLRLRSLGVCADRSPLLVCAAVTNPIF
jgi:hypothetical protein